MIPLLLLAKPTAHYLDVGVSFLGRLELFDDVVGAQVHQFSGFRHPANGARHVHARQKCLQTETAAILCPELGLSQNKDP